MQISSKGVDLIASFEGCKLEAYQDVAGVWTIGYGHTAGVRPGQVITQEKAKQYLEADVANFVNGVNRAITTHIITFEPNQNQFDALVSFAFNLGNGCITTLCRNRDAGDVADAMLLYCKAGGKVNEGLKKRREKERALFITPVSKTVDTPKPAPAAKVPDKVAPQEIKEEAKAKSDSAKVTKSKSVTSGTVKKAPSSKKTTTEVPKCPFKKIAKNRTIQSGASGEGVKWIQWQLNNRISAGLAVNGIYDTAVEEAVKKFQKKHRLAQSGVCTPKTIEKLSL